MLQPRCYRSHVYALLLLAMAAACVRARRRTPSLIRHQTVLPTSISRRMGLLLQLQHDTAFLVPKRTSNSRYTESLLLTEQLRGGSDADSSEEEEDSDDDDDDDDSSDESEDEDVDDDDDVSDDEEEDEEDEEEDTPKASSEPVPVTIKPSTGSKLLDQSPIELQTVNPSRATVGSLKQSVSRQLPARPPVAAIQLSWNGKLLTDNNVLVEDLIDDEDDDDEEEEEGAARLVLQLDMVPSVDPKFDVDLALKMPDMTNAELLEAYAINEASIYKNAALLLTEEEEEAELDDEEEDDEDGSVQQRRAATAPVSVNAQIREQAARIRRNLEASLLKGTHAQELLADLQPPSAKKHEQAQKVVDVKGDRVRRVGTTGVKSSWKRVIQQNMNVNWSVTIRHFCLFLFFGWFGGRTPVSRAILFLGAPAVFFLQARPVKFMLKQAWYTVFDHPPGILLSLLPAPQQKILSLNVDKEMQDMYGNHVVDTAVAPREEEDDDDDIEDYDEEEDDDDDDEYDVPDMGDDNASSYSDDDYDDEEDENAYYDDDDDE